MDTGEFPGFEFEVPRGAGYGPRHAVEPDSLRDPRDLRTAPRPAPGNAPWPASDAPRAVRVPPARARSAREVRRPAVVTAGRGVLAVMRGRNWLLGLAAPLLVAIVAGIAVVVVTGGSGGGGAAPSALAAGFPPARLAGPDFTGTGTGTRVTLSAIGASDGTEVAAGGADGVPALWVSADGGSGWTRAALGGPSAATLAGGQLAGVAHGAGGWLAVGTTAAGAGGPLLVVLG